MVEVWMNVRMFGWPCISEFENEIREWAKYEWGVDSKVEFDRTLGLVTVTCNGRTKEFTA